MIIKDKPQADNKSRMPWTNNNGKIKINPSIKTYEWK